MDSASPDTVGEQAMAEPDQITLPRWVVYFQGALLGVVAITFFVFGMMVGAAGWQAAPAAVREDCEVQGRVLVSSELAPRGDAGAVVLFLPVQGRPVERVDPDKLHPDRFQPLENPAIRMIHDWGGAVSRVDENGRFQVVVDQPGDYYVVAVSRERERGPGETISRKDSAIMATWFLPRDRLVGDQAVQISRFRASRSEANLGDIQF